MSKRGNGSYGQKSFRDALRIAVLEKDGVTKHKKLRKLAEALVAKGLDGDVQAIKEIADRLDGRVPQGLEHAGSEGGPLVISWLPSTD